MIKDSYLEYIKNTATTNDPSILVFVYICIYYEME